MPDNPAAFLAVSVALTAAPGPDVLFLVSQGLAGGSRAGLCVALGLSSGLLVHTTLAALGVSAIFMASPAAFNLLKFAGAAYLFWLAIGAFRERPAAGGKTALFGDGPALYRKGILMNLLNPKVAIFFLALLPQFVNPSKGGVKVQMMILGLMFMTQVIVVFGTIGYLSGRLGERFIPGERWSRGLSVFKGMVFLVLSISLLAARR